MIQKFRNSIEILSEKAQVDLTLPQWMACVIGFLLMLNAGNACSSILETNWGKKSGPISIVNQAPIQLLFLQAVPDKAETLPKGQGSLSLNTTITNTLLSESSGNYEGVVDMEMIRASLELQYGILQGLEIGMSLPFVYSYSGVMDNTILDVERFFFDNTRTVRVYQEAGKYEYYVKRENKAFISGKGKRSTGIGDLALRVKGKIWDEGNILPCLSTRLAVKVPSGDTDRALGSGEPDYGFGILLQKDIKRLTAYLNADVIFPGDAFEDEDVSLNEFYEFMLGAEYRICSRLSILAQVNCITRPFHHTGLQMLDRRIYDALLGINYLTKGGVSIQAGTIEDFKHSGNAGADITFFLNVGKDF
ncbi:MAG: DUF3187 family protein [Deltaproteobacteria bacterium]|nr:MAG: DUF3187 family protein [Deltaproteobacteria bacterium]